MLYTENERRKFFYRLQFRQEEDKDKIKDKKGIFSMYFKKK